MPGAYGHDSILSLSFIEAIAELQWLSKILRQNVDFDLFANATIYLLFIYVFQKEKGENDNTYNYLDLLRTRNLRNIIIIGVFLW